MSIRLLIGALAIAVLSILVVTEHGSAHTPHDDVYGLEISPTYSEDQTAYAIIRGNFFRTIDGGETWQRLVVGLDNAYGFHSMTLSPAKGDVLYMSSLGDGIYKSIDNGDTWTAVNNQLPDLHIRQIVASESTPDVVLAVGNQDGLYHTSDGGESWQEIDDAVLDEAHLTAISFVSSESQSVYVGDASGNIYVSNDLGLSWDLCCSLSGAGSIMALGFSDGFENDQTLFVGTESGGVFVSMDGGQTFEPQNAGLNNKNIQSLLVSSNFAADQVVYAVTRHHGVFRSDDGGKQWVETNIGLYSDVQALEYKRPTFTVIRATETFAQDQTLLLASFTGVYKTEDRGDTWQAKDTLLGEIVVGLAVAPPVDSKTVVGVSQYIGSAYLFNEEQSFGVNVEQGLAGTRPLEQLMGLMNGNGLGTDPDRLLSLPMRLHDVAFSPSFAKDETAFVSLRNHLLRTTDAGRSWESININNDRFGIKAIQGQGRNLIGFVLALSPTFETDNTLFVATQNGAVLQSTDRGTSVTELGTISDKLTAMQVSSDYSNDSTLFAAGYHTGIHKSVDAGKTWLAINNGLDIDSGLLAGEFQLAVSPNYGSDQTVFVGSVAGLFKSSDGGASWNQVPCGGCSTEWNVSAVAVSPDFANDRTVVFSAKGLGILKSVDGGNSFELAKESLIDQGVSIGNLHNSPTTSGAIKFSPNFAEDKTIYGFSGALLVKSTDAGDTWSFVPNDYMASAQTTQLNLVFGQYLLYPLVIGAAIVGLIVLILGGIWLARRRRSRKPAVSLVQSGVGSAS